MSEFIWGLLGSGVIASSRRTRTLGLGDVVREFNELAAPGMGGVWFAKQVVLALLGIEVASRFRDSGKSLDNIRAANAVEALACVIGLKENDWIGDARLRGKNKMYGQDDLSFSKVSASSFYVTQPMRMATVQTLPALGLVTASSSRFNSYRLSERGQALINACAGKPCYYKNTAIDLIIKWAEGGSYALENNEGVRSALSPLNTLDSKARVILHDAVLRGQDCETQEKRQRRQNALKWVERLRTGPSANLGWEVPPNEISQTHWHDLQCGAVFFALRDAALRTLEQVEHTLGISGQHSLTLSCVNNDQVRAALEDLHQRAAAFFNLNSNVKAANSFAKNCVQENAKSVLTELLNRDGRVLRLVGNNEIRPGSAYLGRLSWLDASEDSKKGDIEIDQASENLPLNWPEGISDRIRNLFLFNADLKGDLDRWIINAPVMEEEA